MDLSLVRDLFFISLVCHSAALVWAGWAQGNPPSPRWLLVLRVFSWLAALGTAASLCFTVVHWGSGPAGRGLARDWTPVFIIALLTLYIGVTGAVVARRLLIRWSGFATPWVLLWFSVAIGALVWPTGQEFLLIAGAALAAAAVAAAVMQFRAERRDRASGPSRRAVRARAAASAFWCGLLAAPVLLVTGGAVFALTLAQLYG
ncbi:hypothetical protein [Sediminivirga luteola]|uniref:Uncharacterized protein n=1 Tax=Sediminivirga luteola TaxID=1774748 RepID=A0A8J2TW51_9MICO|nr:hypothetical protein [Sediminivirga luteola]MCI2265722.1 hypothetical protein [Sediminivirga luteola]GGA07148.1 hypothetical protein GCM10011333_07250 [Sediminivirga luteola]